MGANAARVSIQMLREVAHGLMKNRPPQRDWRDWFIMATVTSGVGYGLYTVAKVL